MGSCTSKTSIHSAEGSLGKSHMNKNHHSEEQAKFESAYCGIYSMSSHTELWDVLAFFLKKDREDQVLRDSMWQSRAYAVNGQCTG